MSLAIGLTFELIYVENFPYPTHFFTLKKAITLVNIDFVMTEKVAVGNGKFS